jgi:putative transposase
MVGKIKTEVKDHMTLKEILKEIKSRKVNYDLTERLIFISYLLKGLSIPQASKNMGIAHSTGYIWLERWNFEGLKGLYPKYAGGRPPKLSEKDLKKLDKIFEKTPNLTNKIALDIIKQEFDVEFSYRNIGRILKKLKYVHCKSSMIYSKISEDMEH